MYIIAINIRILRRITFCDEQPSVLLLLLCCFMYIAEKSITKFQITKHYFTVSKYHV